MHTFTSALALVGVDVPVHLEADADVPILSAPQAQGDVLIFPATPPEGAGWEQVPAEGIRVVHGEESGNTHWLHAGFDSPGIRWTATDPAEAQTGLTLGYLDVPDGQSALLIHTDEHGANGIAAGTYALHRKREFARPSTDTVTTAPAQAGRQTGGRMSWWQVVLD
jgi:hypothetical protein